jgi:hypothetical protein
LDGKQAIYLVLFAATSEVSTTPSEEVSTYITTIQPEPTATFNSREPTDLLEVSTPSASIRQREYYTTFLTLPLVAIMLVTCAIGCFIIKQRTDSIR